MKVNMFRVKGKNYGLVISDLFSPIVPEQSSVKVMAMLYEYIHIHSHVIGRCHGFMAANRPSPRA